MIFGYTTLHCAVKGGHLNIVQLLLNIHDIDTNEVDEKGNSLLHSAAQGGDIAIVKLLLERTDIDPNKVNKFGYTTLHFAVKGGHLNIIQLLLNIQDINTNKVNEKGNSLLHSAAQGGDIAIVKLLLERTDIDPNKVNKYNQTPYDVVNWEYNLEEELDIYDEGFNETGEEKVYDEADLGDEEEDEVKETGEGEVYDDPEDEFMETGEEEVYDDPQYELNEIGEEEVYDEVEYEVNETGEEEVYETGEEEVYETGKEVVYEHRKNNQAPINVVGARELCEFGGTSEKHAIKQLLQSYMNKDRSVTRVIPTEMEQETTENDGVNPDLLPFAGTSEDFHKLLSTGTYESFENRVFLCGSCACGKSTLASVLIGTPIPRSWKSTDGLVIHFGRNGINLETFEMVPLNEEARGPNVLTKVVIGKPNSRTSVCQPSDSNKEHHIVQSHTGTNNPEPINLAITKNTFSRSKESEPSAAPKTKSQKSPSTTISFAMKNTAPISLPKMTKIEAYAIHDDILKEVKSGQYKIKIAPSDLVDFGGQRSYDMTHQLFVQHGGTFVVMFDGSKDFHEPLKEYPTGDISNESIVHHWVNSILTYCVDDSDVMPMILFAATHSDLVSKNMQKERKIMFAKKVTEMFGTHEMKKHIIFDPVFFINGTDTDDPEIQNLKKQLVNIAKNQPSWGVRRPMIWVPLELLISNMKKDNINITLKTQLVEANTMNGDLALSDKQLDEFLLTQHELGKIMYFNQPELNNFIILYPPALVNILRSFITDEMFWPEDDTLRNIHRRMTDTGKIYKTDLLKLWKQKKFHSHIPDDDFKDFIIHVLVHLDVLVQPKRYSNKSDAHVDYFLVPCTVKRKMPMSFMDDKSFASRTLSLVYRLQKSCIPSALSFKLIGAVSSIWPIMELNGRPLLYHSSAVLCVDVKTEFRIIVADAKVIVYLTHATCKSFISPDIAASIQECLSSTLEVVLKFYQRSIGKSHQRANLSNLFETEVGVVCGRSPCVVSISKAKRNSKWVCDSGNEHSSRYPLLWFFNKIQADCPAHCPGLSKTILTNSPSEQQLARLADQLPYNSCRKLILHLGLEQKDWEDIETCYTGLTLIIKIMALHSWKIKRIKGKPKKSFGHLKDAMKAIGDERHLLCKVFREDTDLLDIADVRLQEVPHDEVLNGLPQNIGNCAIQLGIELGITISSIKETMVRHHKDMYGQISDILIKWKSSRKELKPTIYRLMLALERVDTGGLEYLKDKYLEK
ncbi:uncharacterized protein [Mytilus edulis]|uniref:uncharacterized protein n=1 Tax=Mytilus edulis TaxID=6550 RepID=UPI0039F05991